MVIASLGIVIWFNYMIKRKDELAADRLAMASRVETDILLTDQDARERRFGELRGKVFVVSWLYTTCPRGCAGLAVELAALQKEFAHEPNFALVSVTVDPEHDQPPVLKNWTTQQGFKGDNWWFVTGKESELIPFMAKNFDLKRSKNDRPISPEDKWIHTMAFSLVDAKANLRGERYYPFSELNQGRYFPRDIRVDIRRLLDEMKQQP